MNELTEQNTTKNNKNLNSAHIQDKASAMLEEGKQKFAHALEEGKERAAEFYQHTKEVTADFIAEGKHKMAHAQDNIMKYNDELIELVKEKPLTAIVAAGVIGYCAALMLRKK